VPGLTLVAHARPKDCCGSAGIYNLLHPDLAREIGRRKAESLLQARVDLVRDRQPRLLMQIESHLRLLGHSMPVRHPIELLVPPA
jgi:glycolate oxidase iron-sulfur subunit